MLNRSEITSNYLQTVELCGNLLKNSNFPLAESHPEFTEITQTAVAVNEVVWLIQNRKFNKDIYTQALKPAINSVKKELFPDTRKKRFISLSSFTENSFISDKLQEMPCSFETEPNTTQNMLAELKSFLPAIDYDYLQNALLPKFPDVARLLNLSDKALICCPRNINSISRKISLLRKFYPDGRIILNEQPADQPFSDEDSIRVCYLNILLGIEKNFPPFFFNENGPEKAAIITRFLIEQILQISPKKILQSKDSTFFIEYKLQPLFRLFNYSINRVLSNAYPEQITPWMDSRTNTDFWKNTENRVQAVQWLVERKLKIDTAKLFSANLTRKDFASCGLSYLFNNYYNSVSKALAEAYSNKQPWELGNVPYEFWNENNTRAAIQWVINCKNWRLSELSARVRRGDFNRKTFAEFGLATLFERKFSKSIYRAVNFAYPGKFEPWEFGKVPSEFWNVSANIFRASKWIAEQEGLKEEKIIPAIRKKSFTIKHLKNYSIGQALKRISGGKIENLFQQLFNTEFKRFLTEQQILRKINSQTAGKSVFGLIDTFFYGLFAGNNMQSQQKQMRHYRRIARRIYHNSDQYL